MGVRRGPGRGISNFWKKPDPRRPGSTLTRTLNRYNRDASMVDGKLHLFFVHAVVVVLEIHAWNHSDLYILIIHHLYTRISCMLSLLGLVDMS